MAKLMGYNADMNLYVPTEQDLLEVYGSEWEDWIMELEENSSLWEDLDKLEGEFRIDDEEEDWE